MFPMQYWSFIYPNYDQHISINQVWESVNNILITSADLMTDCHLKLCPRYFFNKKTPLDCVLNQFLKILPKKKYRKKFSKTPVATPQKMYVSLRCNNFKIHCKIMEKQLDKSSLFKIYIQINIKIFIIFQLNLTILSCSDQFLKKLS